MLIQHNTNKIPRQERRLIHAIRLGLLHGCVPSKQLQGPQSSAMNNMSMEHGRMRKEPDNQSSGKATAKIDGKTSAAAFTF